jgi:hypothetical protein
MQTNEDAANYFEQFKAKLIDSQPWPGSYLYKFIVKKESPHLEQIKSFFARSVFFFERSRKSRLR